MNSHPPEFAPNSLASWRNWLKEHHQTEKGCWLILYKKGSCVDTVDVNEALDEDICWGWIDSKVNKRDEKSYKQYYAPRNPKSNWSRINKEKVERLFQAGRMQEAGHAMIALAKETGTWDALNDVENLIIPPDLQKAFDQYPNSLTNWENFPRSVKRGILEWILNAKRPATRAKRIEETAAKAEENIRANQWRG
ncbi:MAG: YdeI/OmpD-associated family protein [Bacteroidota bacterium]